MQETIELCSVFLKEIAQIPNSLPSWNMLDFTPLTSVHPIKHALLQLTSGISLVWKKEPPKTLLQDLKKMHMNYVCVCTKEL